MSLAALQRDFQGWLDREDQAAAGRIAAPGHAGLAVYLNNYRAQLLGCLRESFDKTLAWLGDAAFDGAAATHIDECHPSSWTLDAYAVGFPSTLARLYPDDADVSDLARLELALSLAFVAPDSGTLAPATLREIDWDHAVLVPAPSFAIITVTTNAAAIWSALELGEQPPPSRKLSVPAPLAVWKQDFVPLFRTLDENEASMLSDIARGHSFEDACVGLARRIGEADAPQAAGRFLAQWLGEGLIVDVC